MMKIPNRKYHADTAFLDLLFNSLIGFVALFFLAYMLINPEQKESKNVEAKAEFIITVDWPQEYDDDIDVYVEDPEGHLVSFRRREDGLMHLDRDDLGHRNDTIETQFGTVKYGENREIVTIRGIIPGEYVVNIHAYKKEGSEPIPVTVVLDKINPFSTVVREVVEIRITGDEKTAFRFVLDKDGDVKSFNKLKKSLMSVNMS
tara:strand:- start:3167 stop:3775 length:609 start_codon:yes stop_codon:yes gene_type:complete